MSDYIKRDDAIKALDCIVWSSSADHTRKNTLTAIMRGLPTADVRENARGKWWHEPNNNNTWIQRCSNCFQIAMITIEEECPYNYCPICGADMRGGKE